MTFGRQDSYNFNKHPWFNTSYYSKYTTPHHPFFGAHSHDTHSPFLKGPYSAQGSATKLLDRMEKDIAAMPHNKKSSVVINALKTHPNKADEIILHGLKAMKKHGKAELAELKADLVAFNPTFAKKLQQLDPKLTDTSNADLRSVGPKIQVVMATMGDKSGIENSQVAENLNFSGFGAGKLNVKGVISGGTTFGGQTIEANGSTKIRQERPDARLLSQNADTGHQVVNVWDFKPGGSTLNPAVEESTSAKVTPDGTMLQAKQMQPQWAGVLGIPDAPSLLRTST